MKKRFLILAAVAVSGVAAVVASNTNKFFNSDADARDFEYRAPNGMYAFCIESSGTCRVGTSDGTVVHKNHYPESCTFNF